MVMGERLGQDARQPEDLVILTDGSWPDAVGTITRAYDRVSILPLDAEPHATEAAAAGAVIIVRELSSVVGLLGRVADAQADASLVVAEQAGPPPAAEVLARFDARTIAFVGTLPVVTLSPARQGPGTADRWVPWLGSAGTAMAPPVAPSEPADVNEAPDPGRRRPSAEGPASRAARRRLWVRELYARPLRRLLIAAVFGAALAGLAALAFSSVSTVLFFALIGLLQVGSFAALIEVLVRSQRMARRARSSERRIEALRSDIGRLREDVTTATGVVATNAITVRELVRHIDADETPLLGASGTQPGSSRPPDADQAGRQQAECSPAQVVEATDAAVAEITVEVPRKISQQIAQLRGSLLNELQALEQLMARYEPAGPLPPVTGWAMNPTGLMLLADHIERTRPSLVVECGSGTSTLWMSLALRQTGRGRLVALEHLPEFAEQTRSLLDRHGLSEWAEVRHVPLAQIATPRGEFAWYDIDPAALSGIGLLLVDGPPGMTGPHARYPALPVLGAGLLPDATIVLDDAERSDEREIVAWWLAEDDRLRAETGLAPGVDVLRRV
jgi:hypothetical protein